MVTNIPNLEIKKLGEYRFLVSDYRAINILGETIKHSEMAVSFLNNKVVVIDNRFELKFDDLINETYIHGFLFSFENTLSDKEIKIYFFSLSHSSNFNYSFPNQPIIISFDKEEEEW